MRANARKMDKLLGERGWQAGHQLLHTDEVMAPAQLVDVLLYGIAETR